MLQKKRIPEALNIGYLPEYTKSNVYIILLLLSFKVWCVKTCLIYKVFEVRVKISTNKSYIYIYISKYFKTVILRLNISYRITNLDIFDCSQRIG